METSTVAAAAAPAGAAEAGSGVAVAPPVPRGSWTGVIAAAITTPVAINMRPRAGCAGAATDDATEDATFMVASLGSAAGSVRDRREGGERSAVTWLSPE